MAGAERLPRQLQCLLGGDDSLRVVTRPEGCERPRVQLLQLRFGICRCR